MESGGRDACTERQYLTVTDRPRRKKHEDFHQGMVGRELLIGKPHCEAMNDDGAVLHDQHSREEQDCVSGSHAVSDFQPKSKTDTTKKASTVKTTKHQEEPKGRDDYEVKDGDNKWSATLERLGRPSEFGQLQQFTMRSSDGSVSNHQACQRHRHTASMEKGPRRRRRHIVTINANSTGP